MNPPQPYQPTEAEVRDAMERAKAIQEYRKDLDRMMPPTNSWRPHMYVCQQCGCAVLDRQVHLNAMHSGSKFFEMLKELFGDA
jgi:hypothetical protein